MPKINLEPATTADIPELAAIHRISFRQSGPLYNAVAGSASDESLDKTMVYRLENYLKMPNMRVFKAVEEGGNGRPIGLGWWTVPWSGGPVESPMRMMPEGANQDVAQDLFEKLKEVAKSRPEQRYELEILSIHPDHQRMGVGRVLLQWGLDAADSDGVPVYLDATPAGIPMYNAFNFVQDAPPIVGLEKRFELLPMRRDPKSS
ncbi:acyl-CoA N-acyltransferase [Meredithblackwellia eburnea MCA 4105]